MNKLRESLKSGIIVADGAAGTYFPSLFGRGPLPCEALNLEDPELVARLHRQYVQAGAKLIYTNTFAASAAGGSVDGPFDTTRRIILEGARLAREAAGEDVHVAADIGPLPETSLDAKVADAEYRRVIDAFLDAGLENFVFETFAAADHPIKAAKYIKSRLPDAFVLISFAVLPDGYSREGIDGQRLVDEVKAAGIADAVGFNCCSGPAHLLSYASTVDYGELFPVIEPNAGYPQREAVDALPQNAGVTYSGSPEYFASQLSLAARRGFRIIGGCCGTTPRHIELLARAVAAAGTASAATVEAQRVRSGKAPRRNFFRDALLKSDSKKVLVVELEPPFGADISRFEAAAALLRGAGIDAVTVADSPMARARADSVAVASRLFRTLGLEVIPHICCRDKNLNAIKSSLVAAHIEGIRNLLLITGDPIPDTDRGTIKSVFNFNSEGLLRFVQSLNGEVFRGDPMYCGCAFNVNAKNPDVEFSRLEKKVAAGAGFVLTQPVVTPEAVKAVAELHRRAVPVLAGIVTPVSYKNAFFLANEMPGFHIPQGILDRFSPEMTRAEGEDAGVAISVELAKAVAPVSAGLYFIVPFNRASVTKRVIDALRAEGVV